MTTLQPNDHVLTQIQERIRNEAIVQELVDELKDGLKDILMNTAEQEVDKIVDKVSQRFKLKLENHYNPLYAKECINLTW